MINNFIAYNQAQSVVSILKESSIPMLTTHYPLSNSVENKVMTYKNPPMKDFDISLLEGSSVKIKNLIVQVICKEKGMVVSFNSKYEKPGLD